AACIAADVGLADGGDSPLRAAGLPLVPRLAPAVSRRPADHAAGDLDDLHPGHLCRVAAPPRPLWRAGVGARRRVWSLARGRRLGVEQEPRAAAYFFGSTQLSDPASFTATFG